MPEPSAFTSAIGLVAAALTTIAYVPQVTKTWRSRSAKDLSLPMLLLFSTGVALWLLYGLRLRDAPIIAANSLTLLLTGVLLYLKFSLKG